MNFMRKFYAGFLSVALSLVINSVFYQIVFADEVNVSMVFSSLSSTLTVAAPGGSVNFSSTTAATSAQTATATITGITVTDGRGTAPGWTVSSSATNLGITGAALDAADNLKKTVATSVPTSAYSLSGVYDGLDAGSGGGAPISTNTRFRVEVTAVTGSGANTIPSAVTLYDGENDSSTPTVTDGDFTFNGLTMMFEEDSNWSTSTIIVLNLDGFAYTDLTATPSGIAGAGAAAGDVDAGSAAYSTGSAAAYASAGGASTNATSDARADYTFNSGLGTGSFTYNLGLSQSIHAYPTAGSYQTTVTLTVA